MDGVGWSRALAIKNYITEDTRSKKEEGKLSRLDSIDRAKE